MKKIFVIAQYTAMPGEESNGRFSYITDLLVDAGHEVEIISTNFYHRDKKHRKFEPTSVKNFKYKFTNLINNPWNSIKHIY